MAGNKKDSNTSKTAHVMNLISRGRSSKPQPSNDPVKESPIETEVISDTDKAAAVQSPAPQASQTPAPPSAPPVSPIISLMNADAKASAVIKDALEESLLQELQADSEKPDEVSSPNHTEEEPPVPSAEETAAVQAPVLTENPVQETLNAPTKSIPTDTAVSYENIPAFDEQPIIAETPFSGEEPASEPLSASEDNFTALENSTAAEEAAVSVSTADPEPSLTMPLDPPAETDTKAEVSAPIEAGPALQELSQENVSSDKSSADTSDAKKEDIPRCINVMEQLVEKSADKYIKMFGLCSCPRCRADVVALALTHLAPQYIVAPENELSFRMIIYEKRFSTEVTAQILHACKKVMDFPRHELN